ncbi:MAG: hypothetical protein IBJ13_12885, partial [Sphingopyxis sp.]|nr:hypothetical protein [Sphingopyxis sp.]
TQAAGCPAGQIDVVVNGQFTGVPTCFRNAASATAAASQGFTQSIDPNIKIPSVLRANVGFSSELNFAESGFFSGWKFNADYIYSKYRDAYTIVDLSQVPDPRGGTRPAFAIDGRPMYVTIDPLNAGCTAQLVGINPTPTYTGVNAACFTTAREDELMLTNGGSFRSHSASALLSKNFDGGLFTENGSSYFSIGYAFSDSQDRRNMYNSTAGSNYDQTAAFDRQNPAASRGFYNSRHNITVSSSFEEKFFGDLGTRIGATFVARSGRPYSLTFSGSGVFGDSASGSDNALAYIPTGANDPNVSPSSTAGVAQAVADFASSLGCAKGYLGKTIERNTCSNDWYFDVDLSFSQELPGPGNLFGRKDKIKLYATMDNFLNFLDQDWNVQRRRDFAGRQDIATVSGVDAQGRYIFTSAAGIATFDADNAINVSSSVWRLKVGVSYEF